MLLHAFEIALPLFLMMDPVGNVPLYVALLKDIPPKRQKIVIIRELLIALITIVLFIFVGESLLGLLGVRQETVQIAGGIILFVIALKLVFPSEKEPSARTSGEPFIVPLAIPFVAGPSVLAAVMIYSRTSPLPSLLGATFIAWVGTAIILVSSTFLKRILGEKGISACERLMGLILTLIAIQMFLEGFRIFLTQVAP